MRASGEADGFVASSEVDVEPSDQCMDEVISAAVKCEWRGEGQISGRACVEIEGEDRGGVGHNRFDFNGVNKRLCKRGMLKRRVVKSVDVVPDYIELAVVFFIKVGRHTSDLLILVLAILNSSHENCSLVRENQAIGSKIFVSGIQDGVKHGLIEQEISHPLRDYDVDLREW